MSFDVNRFPSSYLGQSNREEMHIKFRTSQADGLLWYVGSPEKSMYLYLKVKQPRLLLFE
jgi:hypothetical protein